MCPPENKFDWILYLTYFFWNSFCLFFLFKKFLLMKGWFFFFFVLLSRVTYPSVKWRHRSCIWFLFYVGKLTDQSNSLDFILVFFFSLTPLQLTKNLFYQLITGVESEEVWDSVCVCRGWGTWGSRAIVIHCKTSQTLYISKRNIWW